MNTTTHNDIRITESEAYTIIKIPKQRTKPTVPADDIRFDEFVGMLEDDPEDAGKTPVAVEDSAHDIWRTTAD
jgi:hypothetical protein